MKTLTVRPRAALTALALTFAASLAAAQAFPTKPITLIVPFPPGGSSDALARSLTTSLSQSLGQPVIVESRPGAGATVGADFVAKAKPDGYTLLMGAVHHTIATSVYKKLPYNFETSFAPITTVALVPRACYELPVAISNGIALGSMRVAKTKKCNPLSTSGSLS